MRAYLEAYRLTAETVLALLSARGGATDRRAAVKEALERGRAAFLSGGIALRESLSKAHVENALEWLAAQGVVAESAGRLSVRDGGAGLRRIVDGIAPLLAT